MPSTVIKQLVYIVLNKLNFKQVENLKIILIYTVANLLSAFYLLFERTHSFYLLFLNAN
jgi:hypothetical protein